MVTGRLLTAANTVEPLVASRDSTPPNMLGSRTYLAGSAMWLAGVAFSVIRGHDSPSATEGDGPI